MSSPVSKLTHTCFSQKPSSIGPLVKTLTCFYFSCLQRSDIVKAAYEPTDEECEWKADEEEELTVSKQVQVTYTPACFPSNWVLVYYHLFFSSSFKFMHAAYSLIQNRISFSKWQHCMQPMRAWTFSSLISDECIATAVEISVIYCSCFFGGGG